MHRRSAAASSTCRCPAPFGERDRAALRGGQRSLRLLRRELGREASLADSVLVEGEAFSRGETFGACDGLALDTDHLRRRIARQADRVAADSTTAPVSISLSTS